MQWEKDADKAMERAPFFVRKMAKKKIEETVSREGRGIVTLDDVHNARDRQMRSSSPPNMRSELTDPHPSGPVNMIETVWTDGGTEKLSGFNESQIHQIEALANSQAQHETRFYLVKGCGGAVGCPLTVIDQAEVAELSVQISQEIERSGFPQSQASKISGPVLSHHQFKTAVATCPNSCSEPQIKDFALIARSRPATVEDSCTGCGSCSDACRERAVSLKDGRPTFDHDLCLGCELCARACPTDAIGLSNAGFDVLVGGRLGRHPRLAETIATGVDRETAMRYLKAALRLIIEEGQGGERLGLVLDRIGTRRLIEMVETPENR